MRFQLDKKFNDAELKNVLSNVKLTLNDSFEAPPIVIRVNDSIIGTLGNFSSSTGKAKSRKTFNVTSIVSAGLSKSAVLNYSVNLPEGKEKIIFIDTEQSKYHCKKVIDRIVNLAGLNKDTHPVNLEFVSLRPYYPGQRIQIIEYLLKTTENIGLVIIDGIRDLAYDINSPQEATQVISKLMKWTEKLNIHIHTVLHQNKGDNFSRGHLGSELDNKSESVITVEKPANDKDISIVRSGFLRDKDFEPFAFSINDNGLPYLKDDFKEESLENSNKKKNSPLDHDPQTLINNLKDIYNGSKYSEFSLNKLSEANKKNLKIHGIKIGDLASREYVHFYIKQGYVSNLGDENRMRLIINV